MKRKSDTPTEILEEHVTYAENISEARAKLLDGGFGPNGRTLRLPGFGGV